MILVNSNSNTTSTSTNPCFGCEVRRDVETKRQPKAANDFGMVKDRY